MGLEVISLNISIGMKNQTHAPKNISVLRILSFLSCTSDKIRVLVFQMKVF